MGGVFQVTCVAAPGTGPSWTAAGPSARNPPPNRKWTVAGAAAEEAAAWRAKRRFWSRWVGVKAPSSAHTLLRCHFLFQEPPRLFEESGFVALDPTQELIFPPELMVRQGGEASGRVAAALTAPLGPQLMAETSNPETRTFFGERVTWVSPGTLEDLVELKSRNPEAPLVMGNTTTGEASAGLRTIGASLLTGMCAAGPDMKFKGVLHPLIISPTRVAELFQVERSPDGGYSRLRRTSWFPEPAGRSAGVWVGAGRSLSELRSLLDGLVEELPEEKTELFRALIRQLRNLGSRQIRNVAVSHRSEVVQVKRLFTHSPSAPSSLWEGTS